MASKYLSQRSLVGLNRIGDVLIPGVDEFPSFSEYGGVEHVDDVLAYVPESDVVLLSMVLSVLAFLPEVVLRWLARKLSATTAESTGLLAPLYRQLNLGLRGILFSLYYGSEAGVGFTGQAPVDIIGYSINRVEN
jgi:hypothetical protein